MDFPITTDAIDERNAIFFLPHCKDSYDPEMLLKHAFN